MTPAEALYEKWAGPDGVASIEASTMYTHGYKAAWRECALALGAALGRIDIDQPLTPGEDT